jgi:cytochrome bd-type quinol oxidase subunit 1
MGKSCVFAPIIIFFVIFGALIFAFVAFILKMVRKTKKDYWIGTVQDKKYFEK